MPTRRNILTSPAARDRFVQGVEALKTESAGITTAQLGIPSRPGVGAQTLSTWELFVYWHVRAMFELTPPGSGRNAAHSGPAFLPWHRWLMLLLEFQFQRVLGDNDFGLPYWDWAADGDLPIQDQDNAPLWRAENIGGNGRLSDREVISGPFRRTGYFRVILETGSGGGLFATNRGLRRNLQSRFGMGLPTRAAVSAVMSETRYDEEPWTSSSTGGMRNRVEGWAPRATQPNTHNAVHVWIDGDMSPASSPNDPAFYLNHCNVDRIWEAWRDRNPGRPYLPAASAPASLFRHRRNDPLYSILTQVEPTPADVLNVSTFYDYDSLVVD